VALSTSNVALAATVSLGGQYLLLNSHKMGLIGCRTLTSLPKTFMMRKNVTSMPSYDLSRNSF